MSLNKQQASIKRPLEKQKKLLIKNIMGWIRQSFNQRKIGFHPLILCISIKPSIKERCATIQSYPNQDLWKSLNTLKDQELLQQIKQEVYDKTFKLQEKYNNSIIIIQELLNRIENNFNFFQFYKNTQETNLDLDEHVSNLTEINENFQMKKFEKNESESKQLLKQIELCNLKPGSIITIEKQHFHKLSQLIEKISKVPEQLQSMEMKQFKNQLSLLLESAETPLIKKVCIQNEQQFEIEKSDQKDVSQSDISIEELKNQILQQTINEIQVMEPGLKLFLPSYKQISCYIIEEIKQIEESYFSELYYIKICFPETLNPQNILRLWRNFYEPKVNEILLKYKIKTE